MPTYEYACRACGHIFEIVQKMSDDPLVICPECGGDLRKVFAAPAISFKGSGFYATDHGKKGKPSEDTGGSKDEKKESTAPKESKETKGESSSSASPSKKEDSPS